ncbi:BON domain-containing protein [Paraburkholderia sp. MMS20-SJTN17]|uniref:BON domain-containing protein n=1 Tax=Paraburkholderia translucens TaxID=2886945 RepID=A0ABS8KEX1_9BURK|nr:BON domain-containing protein [Paraburkholderia sp. MMS20-SJTN17]MCC8403301.1 BON domain-containing protein [Paraburkholderia sp. MMS20-SJTN17]
MRLVQLVNLTGGTLVVLACLGANAQPTSASGPASVASSAVQSAKEVKAANRQLAKDVRHALRNARSQGLSFTNIKVKANNGAVLLSGSVPDPAQIDLAIAVAKSVAGVESVSSRLVVRSEISGYGAQ